MSSASGLVLSAGVATLMVVTLTAGAALGAVLRVLRVRFCAGADLTGIESLNVCTPILYKKSGSNVPLCNDFVVKKSSL